MIKTYDKFEESFFIDGKFNKKIYEEYYNEDGGNDEGWDWWGDYNDIPTYKEPSRMIACLNLNKLHDLDLLEYKDIVISCVERVESEISNKTYILPTYDDIKNYISDLIGDNYEEYIPEYKLEKLINYIFKEIENYIYD